MLKAIVKDTNILKTKSEKATSNDFNIIKDLIDTAEEHKERCVGLAAIQLGYNKRICIVKNGESWLPIINPIYTKKSNGKIQTMEGCMSLDGERECQRHSNIELMYTQANGKIKKQQFNGFQAVIVQHEIDHMNGILV